MGNILQCDLISLKEALEISSKSASDGSRKIMSGIDSLDSMTNGWLPGELCVFGARPAMGKTGFVLSCIASIVSDKMPVALFSSTDCLNERFMFRLTTALKTHDSDMREIPLYLCMSHNLNLSYIKHNLSKLIKEKNVRCVFIETIQSVFVSEENGNTKEGMERICHELKGLAMEFGIPIIITSELNRSTEYREGYFGKQPRLCDLRSSSAIEQEADTVYLFWRPYYYGISIDEQGNDLREIGELIIAKNSNGLLGSLRVKFNNSTGLIEQLPDNHEKTSNNSLQQCDDVDMDKYDSNDAFHDLVDIFGLDITQ